MMALLQNILLVALVSSFSRCVVVADANELRQILVPKKAGAVVKVGFFHGSFDQFHRGHGDVVERNLRLPDDIDANQEWGDCDFVIPYPCRGGDGHKKRTPFPERLDRLVEIYSEHERVIIFTGGLAELQMALTKPISKTHVSAIDGIELVGLMGSDTAKWLLEQLSDADAHPCMAQLAREYMSGILLSDPEKAETTWGGCVSIPAESIVVVLRKDDTLPENLKIGDIPIKTLGRNAATREISSSDIKEKEERGQDTSQYRMPGSWNRL